jgi:hypothetical protein
MEKEPQPRSIVPVVPRYVKVVMARFCGFARACTELRPGKTRWDGMRHEEYTMELFLAVGLIAATLAGAAGLFETRPSSAANTPPAEIARLEPVRVVGTPFVPNIKPSER